MRPDKWGKAGFEEKGTISGTFALNAIRSLPLKSFRLVDDTKQDLLVMKRGEKDERRTRRHVGFVDPDIIANHIPEFQNRGDTMVDTTIALSYNLKALSALSDSLDKNFARQDEIEKLISEESIMTKRISDIRRKTNVTGSTGYKSATQL
eukprot:14767878-Ditylum_brightwellii.AAC.1